MKLIQNIPQYMAEAGQPYTVTTPDGIVPYSLAQFVRLVIGNLPDGARTMLGHRVFLVVTWLGMEDESQANNGNLVEKLAGV